MQNTPLETWHRVLSERNPSGLQDLIADEAVFYSPVVHAPQRGKKLTIGYLSAALEVFGNDSFRYVRQLVSGSEAVLEFDVEIDGIQVNGVDMIRWNEASQIIEFKVMIRPLKAVNLIHERMAAMLQSRR